MALASVLYAVPRYELHAVALVPPAEPNAVLHKDVYFQVVEPPPRPNAVVVPQRLVDCAATHFLQAPQLICATHAVIPDVLIGLSPPWAAQPEHE